jgi:hypothetical protein
MDRWQATRYFAGVLGDGETKDWNCLRDWGGRRIRHPDKWQRAWAGGTGSRELAVRDGELGPHGGSDARTTAQRAAARSGRHSWADVRAARCFIDTRWPRGYMRQHPGMPRDRPEDGASGRDRMAQSGLALVASICQPCRRRRREAKLPVCIDSRARRASRVATVSDGLAGGRRLTHRRWRFSAFRRQGGGEGTLRESRMSATTCEFQPVHRCRCRPGCGALQQCT